MRTFTRQLHTKVCCDYCIKRSLNWICTPSKRSWYAVTVGWLMDLDKTWVKMALISFTPRFKSYWSRLSENAYNKWITTCRKRVFNILLIVDLYRSSHRILEQYFQVENHWKSYGLESVEFFRRHENVPVSIIFPK